MTIKIKSSDSILLVTHVPIRQGLNGPQIDDQTAAGIGQWLKHFGRVTYCGIEEVATPANSTQWVDVKEIPGHDRCSVILLPRGYSPARMARHYRSVRRQIAAAIPQHRYLCFVLGSLVGDWPSVAAFEAIRQKRRYAAWIDRVEPVVIRTKVAGAATLKRMSVNMALHGIERGTRHLLRRSSVALLQGRETFDYYARDSSDPHCTYDIHTTLSDQIGAEELLAKQQRSLGGAVLRIGYVGRAATMKGPGEWLEVLERIQAKGVPFHATWIGDGPELSAMRQRAAAGPLAGLVDFPGFEGNRSRMLSAMRDYDIFLFCHKTPESARCLIEALVSGAPLVGYDTAYPRGLVEVNGGAALAPQNDAAALADRVVALHRDRDELTNLILAAAASGTLYNEDTVYAQRAELMKRG